MYAIIDGTVRPVTLGEVIDAVGVFQRRHPGHKVTDETGTTYEISDELIYDTEERALKELNHLNRIWGKLIAR